jgi:hypothetical protein
MGFSYSIIQFNKTQNTPVASGVGIFPLEPSHSAVDMNWVSYN